MPKVESRGALLTREKSSPFIHQDNMLLRLPVRAVSETELNSPDTKNIINDMLTTANAHAIPTPNRSILVGLHAIQIGFQKSMFLVDWNARKNVSTRDDNYTPDFRLFINPQIEVDNAALVDDWVEGCFSIDQEIGGIIKRPDKVTLKALEVDLRHLSIANEVIVNEITEVTSDPYVARIVQHEFDHGLGIRFPFHATSPEDLYRTINRPEPHDGETEEDYEPISLDEYDRIRDLATPIPA